MDLFGLHVPEGGTNLVTLYPKRSFSLSYHHDITRNSIDSTLYLRTGRSAGGPVVEQKNVSTG